MEIKKSDEKSGRVAATNAALPTSDEDPVVGVKDDGPTVDDSLILTGRKLFLAHTGFLLAVFCFSLDQTIVATALPKLASQFNALDQLTWVVSVYLLCTAGLMLLFGQLLTVLIAKYVYLSCVVIFEAGSLICGLAPNMSVLILGRAIQGVGASGIFTSILVIFAQITRLESRPILMGSFGAVFGVSSVLGPLLGGVFTDHATWRWCFYINLPIGGISIMTAILFQPANPPPGAATDSRSTVEKVLSLDWIGGLLSVATVICLLLPLQWGGVTRPWDDKVIIALFVVFAVLLIAFIAWEYRKGKDAMMPLSLFLNRSQVGASLAVVMSRIAFLGANYYLPFFYQAKGRSASQSGVDILPFMLSIILSSIIGSGFVKRTGHYYAFLVIGPLFASIGAGLLIPINEATSSARLIGYQIIFGAGIGLALQLPMLAIQAEYADRPRMVPQATSLIMFFQMLGGAIGIAIAGSVFNNQLSKELPKYAPNLPPKLVELVKQSVTVIFELDPTLRSNVVHAYIKALGYVFIVAVPACILCAIASAFIRSWNVKTREEESRKPTTSTQA